MPAASILCAVVCANKYRASMRCARVPHLAQLVRSGIVVDSVEDFIEVGGRGSAAVMTWLPAWIST
jgi:hypothetical protein